MSIRDLVQELRDLHETTLGSPLPYPATAFTQEVGRLLRDLEPERKLRDVFQAALEQARLSKVKLEDLGFVRRIILRERVELRRVVRHVLGVGEHGQIDLGRSDDQLVEAWKTNLTAEEGLSELTIGAYLKVMEAFRRFLAPRGMRLKEIDRDDVIAYKEALLRAENCAASVNGKMSALRSFYNFLVEMGELETTPLRFIKRLKTEHRRLTVLSVKEIEQILGAIDTTTVTGLRDFAMIVLFCATGARLGEVIRLKVPDVDFARGVVVYRERKNDDDAQVVLTPNVQAVLKRYLERARPKLLKNVKNPEYESYFILSRTGRPFHRGAVSNLIALIARKAGLEKAVSAHCFRRSIATALANNGMPAEILKVFLGHRSINTTLNHYVFYADESQRRAVEDYHPLALGKLLPPAITGELRLYKKEKEKIDPEPDAPAGGAAPAAPETPAA